MRDTRIRSQPSSARTCAVPRPMPTEPPVISARLPARPRSMLRYPSLFGRCVSITHAPGGAATIRSRLRWHGSSRLAAHGYRVLNPFPPSPMAGRTCHETCSNRVQYARIRPLCLLDVPITSDLKRPERRLRSQRLSRCHPAARQRARQCPRPIARAITPRSTAASATMKPSGDLRAALNAAALSCTDQQHQEPVQPDAPRP